MTIGSSRRRRRPHAPWRSAARRDHWRLAPSPPAARAVTIGRARRGHQPRAPWPSTARAVTARHLAGAATRDLEALALVAAHALASFLDVQQHAVRGAL